MLNTCARQIDETRSAKNITAFTAVYSLETSRGVITPLTRVVHLLFRHDEIIARTGNVAKQRYAILTRFIFTGKKPPSANVSPLLTSTCVSISCYQSPALRHRPAVAPAPERSGDV